jgi:hypothetical protein
MRRTVVVLGWLLAAGFSVPAGAEEVREREEAECIGPVHLVQRAYQGAYRQHGVPSAGGLCTADRVRILDTLVEIGGCPDDDGYYASVRWAMYDRCR